MTTSHGWLPAQGPTGRGGEKFIARFCPSGAILGIFFFVVLPLVSLAKVDSDNSSKSISPLAKENLPSVKPADPFLAHTQHSFYFKDNLAAALVKFTRSPDFNLKDPVSLNDLGYIYYYFGEYRDAAIQFKKALDLNPAYSGACINLGVTAYKTGDTNLALHYLNQAYEMDPQKGEAAYDLGLICFEQRDYSRAAGFFEESSKAWPQDPKV